MVIMQIDPIRLITIITAIIMTIAGCRTRKVYRRAKSIISIFNAIPPGTATGGDSPFVLEQKTHPKSVDLQILGKLISIKIVIIDQAIVTLTLGLSWWAVSLERQPRCLTTTSAWATQCL